MEISIDNPFCDMEGEELILCDGGGILLGVGKLFADYVVGKVIDYLFEPIICY